MAPSPENDSAPKAPDKAKAKPSAPAVERAPSSTEPPQQDPKDSGAVSGMDETQLRTLLDEAIAYKLPKDRHGKSTVFLNLLNQAEEEDRKARAASASGSERVRYYNRSATRRTGHRREHKSVSENLAQGGSLNNLAKEVLYETASPLCRPPKTVSARQRQGGSLPCNVNSVLSSSTVAIDFEKATRSKAAEAERREQEQQAAEEEEEESQSLLEHDSLNRDYCGLPRAPYKYTSRVNLEIGGVGSSVGNTAGVDEEVYQISSLEHSVDKVQQDNPYKVVEPINAGSHYLSTPCTFPMSGASYYVNPKEKKFDENGNALAHGSDAKKNKKKKNPNGRKVVELEASNVAGHRGDIINDIDKLMEYIGGTDDQTKTKKSKLHCDDNGKKKQRPRSKGGKAEEKLKKKSTSMEEISTTKMDEFDFGEEQDVKRNCERLRERRSWANSEQLPLYANASAENLESADFHVVTKKKKSRKRRNSVNGRGQMFSRSTPAADFDRSLDLETSRRKSACSVPHSEKSNDSSDADSVHSLPIDSIKKLDFPVSYADMAKNNAVAVAVNVPKSVAAVRTDEEPAPPKMDVNNIHTWPAIPGNNAAKVVANRNAVNRKPDEHADDDVVVMMMPRNIPDVQTIEKMHLRQVQERLNVRVGGDVERTSATTATAVGRPAVVILSGEGRGEVSGLTFGFDINEELLSDVENNVCESFAARFHPPEMFRNAHHDKIVNFVGMAWEDIVNQSNGKVKYFSDEL